MIDSAMQPGAAQKAFSMHVESFWQRHSSKVIALSAALLLYVLWCVLCFAEPCGLSLEALGPDDLTRIVSQVKRKIFICRSPQRMLQAW